MSTQRREDRCTRMAGTGLWERWSDSRLERHIDRAGISGDISASPARKLAGIAAGQTAPSATLPMHEATNSLRRDLRNRQQLDRLFSAGSPPTGPAVVSRPFVERCSGDPPFRSHFLAARLHRTLPRVPAAVSCRTERYDGKGNLYFKHAA